MKNVVVTKQARVTLSADEWGLYGRRDAKSINAAAAINQMIEHGFNRGYSRAQLEQQLEAVLQAWREVGSTDTEVRDAVGFVLDELYR